MGSKIFVVPTPIGNLKDITIRALEVLQQVDTILAEDTRNTLKLLKHYNISPKKILSYHKFNEHASIKVLIDRLQGGESMALVSDAGTPAISDPGYLLVRACIDNNIEIEVLPGATAFVPALILSGFPTNSFVFEGFLPHKKGRQKKLKLLAQENRTIILYESPYRLIKLLQELRLYFGKDRQMAVMRELTKLYEEVIRGSVEQIIEYYSTRKVKGEIVVIISPLEN